jgi:hypothetical protein
MRLSWSIVPLLLSIQLVHSQEDEEESDVIENDPWGKTTIPAINGALELNETNYKDAFKAYDRMYVQFYAPWCWHSQDFDKEYLPAAIASAKEKDSKVVFAKMERTLPWHAELCTSWGVPPVTPNVRYVMNGVITQYTGEMTTSGLLGWAKGRLGSPYTKISTIKEAEALIKVGLACHTQKATPPPASTHISAANTALCSSFFLFYFVLFGLVFVCVTFGTI